MRVATAWIRVVPAVLIMGTIFFLSHQPGDELQLPQVPGVDKVAHLVAYGALGAAVLFAAGERKRYRPGAAACVTVCFCILYGVSDEVHQSFVPGRDASLADLVADTLGASLLAAAWYVKGRRDSRLAGKGSGLLAPGNGRIRS
ncbi:MAG: hypothetical protein Kow0089_10920 [Desulfobulbaceae bacterium]